MTKYLKTLYDIVKNNLTMFAIFPTVIGGVWQIIKLFSISPNLIRFFSVSQLISDGIAILLIIVFPLVIFGIGLFRREKVEESDEITLYNIEYLLGFLPAIIPLNVFIVFLAVKLNLERYVTVDNPYDLLTLLFFLILFFSFISILVFLITKEKLILQFYYIVSAEICIIVLFIGFNNITKNLTDIENFTTLINSIEKEKCYLKSPEVLYFNDKYIFIEVNEANKKRILIKRTDDLFED